MPEHPDADPRTPSDGDDGDLGWDGLPIRATAEERAFAASLAELDRADREAGRLDDADVADPAPWDEAVLSDDELVTALGRGVHGADLMLLESIDPRDLSENVVRVDYLRALDRISARIASMRHAAVVAMVGERSTEAYLPEVPGSPTSPIPTPTDRAGGSPPGARPSTSRPGPSSRSTPTHRRRNRNHRHPTTRRLSDSGPSGIGIGTRRGLGHGAPGAAEDWHRIRRSPSG